MRAGYWFRFGMWMSQDADYILTHGFWGWIHYVGSVTNILGMFFVDLLMCIWDISVLWQNIISRVFTTLIFLAIVPLIAYIAYHFFPDTNIKIAWIVAGIVSAIFIFQVWISLLPL